MRVSGGCEARDLRQTSPADCKANPKPPSKQRKSLRHARCSKLRSIAGKTAAPYVKLYPDGWPSRILHFFAESGVLLRAFIRLCSPDCWSSVRIPCVLTFLMKYCASVTAPSSMR
eukprot:2321805-Pyramimonas_sp.AAC.1